MAATSGGRRHRPVISLRQSIGIADVSPVNQGARPRRPPAARRGGRREVVFLTLLRPAKTCSKIRLHAGDRPVKTFSWEIIYDILAVRIPPVSGPPGDMRSVQEEIALCKQVYLMKVRDWSLCTEARRHSPLYPSAMDYSELLILKQ
ncbi:hypothetical protein [Rugamonas sp. DEMB1]|uniref:hypothetical protein n=1 Tax=Rugamonas sp. DEMB1 TaxID=3039386 RepID=UPI00244CA9ED|nr:hypothetical protein [Rugamonas sp. DEMB1]WGG50687.1 hypothetical protein QC826_30640 [Rugamonas sp. DEMB1]